MRPYGIQFAYHYFLTGNYFNCAVLVASAISESDTTDDGIGGVKPACCGLHDMGTILCRFGIALVDILSGAFAADFVVSHFLVPDETKRSPHILCAHYFGSTCITHDILVTGMEGIHAFYRSPVIARTDA